jgi:hypothetical protein
MLIMTALLRKATLVRRSAAAPASKAEEVDARATWNRY